MYATKNLRTVWHISSLVVFETWPWPRGSSRTPFGGLAVASDGQALVMQVLALVLKKRSRPWIEAQANTFQRLERSTEHFQINDADSVRS